MFAFLRSIVFCYVNHRSMTALHFLLWLMAIPFFTSQSKAPTCRQQLLESLVTWTKVK